MFKNPNESISRRTILRTAGIDALNAGLTALNLSLVSTETAKLAYKSAVEDKDADFQQLRDAISQIARTCYANPDVTNAMLESVGLSPRGRSRRPVAPTVVTDLIATPNVDGTVKLKWKRGGNLAVTTFLIEKQVGTGAWEFVDSVTASRVTLTNYAPGNPAHFRVIASRNGISAPASNIASIYLSPAPLELAA